MLNIFNIIFILYDKIMTLKLKLIPQNCMLKVGFHLHCSKYSNSCISITPIFNKTQQY